MSYLVDHVKTSELFDQLVSLTVLSIEDAKYIRVSSDVILLLIISTATN